MKYLIVEQSGFQFPVVFPDLLTHEHVARGLKETGKIISAGFCEVYNLSAIAHGHSESLGLTHRPEDEKLLHAFVRQGDVALLAVQPCAVSPPVHRNDADLSPEERSRAILESVFTELTPNNA